MLYLCYIYVIFMLYLCFIYVIFFNVKDVPGRAFLHYTKLVASFLTKKSVVHILITSERGISD